MLLLGQQYAHTFVSAATNAVNFAGNTANQLIDAQTALCSDVQSAVDTLLVLLQQSSLLVTLLYAY